MDKYLVEITEILRHEFEVEAESRTDAENAANAMYRNETFVLNAEDILDVKFKAYKVPVNAHLQESR